MGTPVGIPMDMDGYGDSDESLWACVDSIAIFEWL